MTLSRLNDEVEERREKREKKRAVSLQPAWTQESRKSVRETSGPYINCEEMWAKAVSNNTGEIADWLELLKQ